jgi:hypothetical protein
MPATDALSSYRDLSILVVFEAFVSYPVWILGAKLGISRHENSSYIYIYILQVFSST